MHNNKKGMFLISLNSKRLHDAIDNKNNFHFNYDINELDVFVFDTYEVLNGIFFNKIDVQHQKKIIEELISRLKTDFISVDISKRELIKYSENRKELYPYILTIYSEYYSNSKFERHCKNQIFQNLQPKLEKQYILDNKSDLIELLIPFLIIEIAVYLFIFNQNEYHKIFGMEKEMNIIKAIKNHKYPTFNKFLTANIEYIQISAN